MPKGSHDGSVYKRVETNSATGKQITRWYARVRYTDAAGTVRELKRSAGSYTRACELKRDLVTVAKKKSAQTLDVGRLTFEHLAKFYKEHYAVPAQYVDERKVAGLRSVKSVEHELEILTAHLGKRLLARLTYGDLRSFRAKRLKTPTRAGGQRAIASVNREMALLRRMLNVALREGWLERNPFTAGDPLISTADERQRERILTLEEEERLLGACGPRTVVYRRRGKEVTMHDDGERRRHLRAIIVCALDTGMRKGEILKLRWSDVDFDNRIITVRAFNTKTMRERHVAMTARLARELTAVAGLRRQEDGRDPLVFGVDDVKRSFVTACADAGIAGVRFHDLRHTAATRLVSRHIPLSEVGKQLGHTQPQTTWRYVNSNIETTRRAAAALDELYEEHEGRRSDEPVN